jgi:acetyl esterase/lipase
MRLKAGGWRLKANSVLLAALLLLSACTNVMLSGATVIETGEAPRVEVAYGPGPRNRADVYRPLAPAANGAPAPVVVFIHGGSWESGTKGLYRWMGQGLAAQGYVAVLPNYGLMPSTGFPDFVHDAAAAVAYARAHAAEWGGDTTRFFLMGHSAGAQIAALLAYDGSYLARVGRSPRDLAGFIGLSGPYDFVLDSKLLQRTFGGSPEREAASQPVRFVTATAPRTLLVMGRDDRTVRPRNTERLEARLREVGASVEALWVPGDHGVTVGAFARPYRGDSEIVRAVDAFIRGTDRSAAPRP